MRSPRRSSRPARRLFVPCALTLAASIVAVLSNGRPARAEDDFERAPIRYSASQPANCITRLQERLDRGEIAFDFDDDLGYVKAVLAALDVPVASQTLVFSKTSLQRHRIAPRTPRALYFGDDVYVGFCKRGDVVEISAVDPLLGTVFYTLDQKPAEQPRFVRQTDNCLICHGSSHTKNVPGHTVRSVSVDASGLPILSSATYRIDHTSPLEHRWGGWYVTGTHGAQRHLGNRIERGLYPPAGVPDDSGSNVVDLADRVDLSRYPARTSDLVALMVLEHQALGHNLIVQAAFQTRLALHQEKELNRELKEPADKRWPSTTSRIRSAGEALARYLLFVDEAPLAGRLEGTTSFARDFAARGPRDPRGRSLREFDLERRMFRYPCSYLVQSEVFAALPAEAKEYVLGRIRDVASGAEQARPFAHLSPEDRRAIGEIVEATVPDAARLWAARRAADRAASASQPSGAR